MIEDGLCREAPRTHLVVPSSAVIANRSGHSRAPYPGHDSFVHVLPGLEVGGASEAQPVVLGQHGDPAVTGGVPDDFGVAEVDPAQQKNP
jgi:hypothetical protein